MTKYILESMTEEEFINLPDGWTPYTISALALITNCEADAWKFDTMTEAQLSLWAIERERPALLRGRNFIVVPTKYRDPQLTFSL